MVNKLCKACLQERPISDFGRDSQKRSGLRTYCHDCNNAKSRRYYAKNADLRKKYYETNKEEIYGKHKERQRKKKEANPEGFLEKQRETNRRYRRRHGSRATELAYRRRLQRVYGIDTDEYKSRLESQGNACAVCRNVPEGGSGLLWIMNTLRVRFEGSCAASVTLPWDYSRRTPR